MAIPLLQAPVDVRVDAAPLFRIKVRPEPVVGTAIGETDRARRERDEHRETNEQLRAENARLVEDNNALREAAAIWIRLYELQLSRANQAVELLARTADPPSR